MTDQSRTALASAHERFLRSLPARGRELRDLCRKLAAVPHDERLAGRLLERLQALHASAQVFDERALLDAVEPVLGKLERASLAGRVGDGDEFSAVYALAGHLGAGEPTAHSENTASGNTATEFFRRELWSVAPPGPRRQEHGTPVAITQSVAGTIAAPDVISILLLANAEVERDLRAALPVDTCEVVSTAEPDTALQVIDQVVPDLVLVEASLLDDDGAALVARLRGARAGGVRAIVALVPAESSELQALSVRSQVDGVIRLPVARAGLREHLLHMAGRDTRQGGGMEAIEAGTVDEIARSVGETVRRGIADSLRVGRGERIELSDSSEVLAAAWSAVARIRTHLAEHARGRIRFDEALFAGGPAALALTDELPAASNVSVNDSLQGRRILLADDDPAVLWFFSSLLREAGAIAIEARTGREALELARRKPPDLLISDILMPEIDGFSLCRELKRDLALSHVPVILLSWKEDFLQRMRELDSGASGYLRKEASSQQILSTVAEALRPRTELAALLGESGEVHGRIDALGVQAVLHSIAKHRPDAHVIVRDAWNVFEAEIRNGSTLAVTRTASDGSFGRGVSALRQLLGVHVGRFVVVDAEGEVRGAFEEPLDKALADGVRHLGAVLDAVSDRRLLRVGRVQFDDEVLATLLTATPTVLADVAARLGSGESAKELVLSGAFAPRDLEHHLRELALRGAIVGVFGSEGEDLVAAVQRARDEQPGALLHGGERSERRAFPRPFDSKPVSLSPFPTRPRPAPAQEEPTEFADPRMDAAPTPAAQVGKSIATAAMSEAELPGIRTQESDDASGHAAEAPRREAPVPPAADEESVVDDALPARSKGVGFLLTLGVLLVIGFFGYRLLMPHTRLAGTQLGKSRGNPSAPAPALEAQHAPEERNELAFGRVLPFIDQERGVTVAEGEGLLVVEHDAATPAPRVRVGERELGTAPLAIALPAGRHELSVQRPDGRTRSRFVEIRAGETRILGIGD